MKFFKIILILTVFCFSGLFADTGDWDTYDDIITNFRGTMTSFVHTEGLFIACHFQSTSTTPADKFPDDDLWVYIKDFDGGALKSTEVNIADDIGCVRLAGNSDRVWVIWSEPYGIYTRIYVKRITFSSGSWGSWTALTPYTDAYALDKGQMMLNAHADEDGLWIVYNNGTDQNEGNFSRLYYSNTSSSYISNGTGLPVADFNYYNNDVVSQENYSGSSDIAQTIFVDEDFDLRSWRGINGSWGYTDNIGNFTSSTYPLRTMLQHETDDNRIYAIYLQKDGSPPYALKFEYQTLGNSSWTGPYTITSYGDDEDLSNSGNYSRYGIIQSPVDYSSVYVLHYDDTGLPGLRIWKLQTNTVSFITQLSTDAHIAQIHAEGNDVYVPYCESEISGATWNAGDIGFFVQDGEPIAPSISKSWSGNRPKLVWSKPCFDVEDYKIYRKPRFGSWTYAGATSNLYWVDSQYQSGGRERVDYKVLSVDYDNNQSGYSNTVAYSGLEHTPSKIIGDFRPTKYALYNAYPNPFNPSTTIEFDIPKDGFVNISVFNSIGEVVGNLVNGQMETGRHQIQFDGSNLPSGIYFIKMNSNQFVKTQKIILTK